MSHAERARAAGHRRLRGEQRQGRASASTTARTRRPRRRCRTTRRARPRRRAPRRFRRARSPRRTSPSGVSSVGAVRSRHSRPGSIAQLDIGAELAIAPRIELPIERRARRVLEREAQQHEARVAVDRLRARQVGERLLADRQLERRRGRDGSRSSGRWPGRPEQCSSRSRSVTAWRSSPVHDGDPVPHAIVEPHPSACELRRRSAPRSPTPS